MHCEAAACCAANAREADLRCAGPISDMLATNLASWALAKHPSLAKRVARNDELRRGGRGIAAEAVQPRLSAGAGALSCLLVFAGRWAESRRYDNDMLSFSAASALLPFLSCCCFFCLLSFLWLLLFLLFAVVYCVCGRFLILLVFLDFAAVS